MSKLMLIDGNSLTYRAFFALPTDITLASGQVTNAVYGFTSMLLNLVRDHQPDGIGVAFDRPEPTFRHEAVADYKAGRNAAPDILKQQMGLVRQVVETLRIPIIDAPGFEADDIIATLATEARDQGDEVLIVTGDRDVYQLVEDPLIRVIYNRRGVSDYANYDEAGIEERTGVPPKLYTQYAALRGDPSDNLPGVPGVGEKTAAKLINSYGGIDGIYEHLDEQTPKLRANLAEHEAQVRSNADVMVLLRDVPLEISPDGLRLEPFDQEEVRKLFDFLEFRTLQERLAEAFADVEGVALPATAVLEAEVSTIDAPSDAVKLLKELLNGSTPLAIEAAWDGPEGRSPLVGLALVTDGDASETRWLPREVLDDVKVRDELRALVGDGGRPIAAHGAKPLMRALLGQLDADLHTLRLDTMLAAYLLDPAESRYLLADLLLRYAQLELPVGGGAASDELQLDLEGDSVPPSLDAARRALAVDRLVAPISAALDAQGLSALHDDIEIPLVRVLARMEDVGIGVDAAELKHLNDTLSSECDELTKAIWEDAGEEFNVNSTLKLREILFDRLGLQPQKKTKTGYSTDASSLEKLAGQHPIVDHLLRYREVEKLRGTYGEGLLAEVQADGRIHATFNQTVARTGRLSSDAPNLHNIPVRSELGREFRKAFIPAAGCELLIADYNQIELRCIAHLAEDPGLIAAFESGQDIHNATAARVFDVAPDKVTIDQRSKAKMVSYGLAYGMEAYGLGQRLNIPTDEAQVILDAYFEAFPNVKAYMEQTVIEARERGYTETLFGRRRQIPELSSGNYRIRQAGERQAMNAGIQGLAADIFKVALVRLDAALTDQELASRIVLQVHDEVLLEVPPDEHDVATELTSTVMAGAAELRVPLAVNLAFGTTWADAKN
ncbi:MAG TPA: DNA polymerase I [Acidimicrobiales bacterium]|nr:DNA polymerase I [Acidimicrobiales bacterium]